MLDALWGAVYAVFPEGSAEGWVENRHGQRLVLDMERGYYVLPGEDCLLLSSVRTKEERAHAEQDLREAMAVVNEMPGGRWHGGYVNCSLGVAYEATFSLNRFLFGDRRYADLETPLQSGCRTTQDICRDVVLVVAGNKTPAKLKPVASPPKGNLMPLKDPFPKPIGELRGAVPNVETTGIQGLLNTAREGEGYTASKLPKLHGTGRTTSGVSCAENLERVKFPTLEPWEEPAVPPASAPRVSRPGLIQDNPRNILIETGEILKDGSRYQTRWIRMTQADEKAFGRALEARHTELLKEADNTGLRGDARRDFMFRKMGEFRRQWLDSFLANRP